MSKPIRVQLSRRKGSRLPPNTVSVARPSKWGNPYKLRDYKFANPDGSPAPFDEKAAREMAVRDFEAWLFVTPTGEAMAAAARADLRGKNLACWCRADQLCHADVLLETANKRTSRKD